MKTKINKIKYLSGARFLAEIKALEKQINGTSFIGIWSYTSKSKGRGENKKTKFSIDITGNQINARHDRKYIKALAEKDLSEEVKQVVENRLKKNAGRTWGTKISKILVHHVNKKEEENFYLSVHRTSERHIWDNGVLLSQTASQIKNKQIEKETGSVKRDYKIANVLRVKMCGVTLYNIDTLKRMLGDGVPIPSDINYR